MMIPNTIPKKVFIAKNIQDRKVDSERLYHEAMTGLTSD